MSKKKIKVRKYKPLQVKPVLFFNSKVLITKELEHDIYFYRVKSDDFMLYSSNDPIKVVKYCIDHVNRHGLKFYYEHGIFDNCNNHDEILMLLLNYGVEENECITQKC